MNEPSVGGKPVSPWRQRLFFGGMALGLLLFVWQLAAAFTTLRQRSVPLVAPGWLAVALGLIIAGYLIQFGAWLLVMRFLRRPLDPVRTFSGYYLSFLPRYIPGTIWGYLGRGEWLARAHAIGYRLSSIGSLLEAGSFVATALLIGAIAYLPAPWSLGIAVLIALGGVLAWPLLARAAAGAGLSRQWPLILLAYSAYFVYWVVQGLGLGAICLALGLGRSVDLLQLTAAAATGWAAGFLTLLVPAGFGVRELSLTYLLTTQWGLPPADANLVAVLSRVCMIVAELLMLALAAMAARRGPVMEASKP
jgi:hypothetical protein